MHLIGSYTCKPLPLIHLIKIPPPSLGVSPRNFRTPSPSPGVANGNTPQMVGEKVRESVPPNPL